jgi:hypothetical protein
MSSCAASCCTCSPKVSCASGISASWPTANVPPPCQFAFTCSAQHQNHLPSKIFPTPARAIFGCAPSAAGRRRSSSDSLPPRSNSVLHLSRSRLLHETTINITKSLRVWARAISLCFVLLQTLSFSLLLLFFRSSIALHPPNPLLALSLLLCLTTPAHLSTTPSFHSIPIRPTSVAKRLLQVAVSKARQSTVRTTSFFC